MGHGSGRAGGTAVSWPRQDFRSTAYYNAELVTDASGHARARFRLPDSLTAYRIRAVAATEDDRFGSVESHVRAALPLMARPALPRLLRTGDAPELGVVVTSTLPSKVKADVSATVEGVALTDGATRSVEVAPGASVEVRFPARVAEVGTGPARVRFEVHAGDAADRVERTLPVRAPQVLEAVALTGDTSGTSAERLGDVGAIRTTSAASRSASRRPRSSGSTPGSASCSIPVRLHRAAREPDPRAPPAARARQGLRRAAPAERRPVAADLVKKLLAQDPRESADGGYGLWRDSRPTVWVTAYALWGLWEAKRAGRRSRRAGSTAAKVFLHEMLGRGTTSPATSRPTRSRSTSSR